MRAVCEGCGAVQPHDWKAGDLCGACGQAVRRDVRCFWCAKWTPQGRFCRACGAETVEERLYGAARMIKEAGTDRFTVPRMLRELDPDQIDNFSRLYQRHAVAVARHVDEVHFLERFLFHKTYGVALEEELIPQLPLADDALERLSRPTSPPGDDLGTIRAIHESTPFGSTRVLAALALVRLGDWKAHREASYALSFDDGPVRAEAALALSGWRVLHGLGYPRQRAAELAAELERSPFRLAAAVRLALMGHAADETLLREALGSNDRETAFSAALALGDVDRLQAALQGDDLEKRAAGSKLIELGVMKPVEQVIEKSAVEVQRELVETLLRKEGPAPEMAETFLEIMETTEDDTLRERAARILCRQLHPAHALRIARAARKERYIFQSLLSEAAALPSDAAAQVAAYMVDEGLFAMHQYGLAEAGTRGAIPDTFVPSQLGRAGDLETRIELLRFGEAQLGARADEDLHRFFMNVVFGDHPARVRAAAWWGLERTFRRDDERRGGRYQLSEACLTRFFGSVAAFVPRLTAVVGDPATLKEVGVYDFLATLFGSAEAAWMPPFFQAESATHELVRALLQAIRGDYWSNLIDAIIKFLGLVGTHPRWRDEVIASLEALDKRGNHGWEKTLRTLRLSVHGLPDEPDFPGLPDDFVAEKFPSATPEGRRHLFQVATEQLIHRQVEAVARFLLTVAFGDHDAATQAEAARIFLDRAPGSIRRFALRPEPVTSAFGSMSAFLPRLTAVLAQPDSWADDRFATFLAQVLSGADVEAVRGDPAEPALVDALSGVAARHPSDALRSCATDLVAKLRPPPPPPAPPPSANPWVEKQQQAERLTRELQEAAMRISLGPGSAEDKSREIMQLQTDFQAKIRALYSV